MYALRGFWELERQNWESAKRSLQEAVALANKVGKRDKRSEIRLAHAKFKLNQLPDGRQMADQWSYDIEAPCHRVLAAFWLAIGDTDRASRQALAAYKWAWADGEPFVHRYELRQARTLLEQLGNEIPKLPHYDKDKALKLVWEVEVQGAIRKLGEKWKTVPKE
jgi:hypothetical protein